MKVAIITQPLDLLIPPYENSIGIWANCVGCKQVNLMVKSGGCTLGLFHHQETLRLIADELNSK